MNIGDTIAAPATPPGTGGVGIIRISGEGALPLLKAIFRPKLPHSPPSPRRLILGHVFDDSTSAVYDEVLAVYMPGPFSYTGEDVVEIQAHGGQAVTGAILNLVLGRGARLAGPGEFTLRAFRNGRIDLAQAEAVFEMTQAKTAFGVQAAAAHLSGILSSEISDIKTSIEDLLCRLTAAVDFPDEVEEPSVDEILTSLERDVIVPLRSLAAHARKNEIVRRGMNVVIAGRPNVGKSSLLNRLLGNDRAIVSSVPGTTRDSISEETLLAGRHVILWDTAGIRSADDQMELLGMEKSRQALDNADAVILVVEAHKPFVEGDISILRLLAGRKVVIAANKSDMLRENDSSTCPPSYGLYPVVKVSALDGSGLGILSDALWQAVDLDPNPDLSHGLLNIRQRHHAEQALVLLEDCMAKTHIHFLPEFIILDIEQALQNLGMITGETASPDILDSIFSRFCIGK